MKRDKRSFQGLPGNCASRRKTVGGLYGSMAVVAVLYMVIGPAFGLPAPSETKHWLLFAWIVPILTMTLPSAFLAWNEQDIDTDSPLPGARQKTLRATPGLLLLLWLAGSGCGSTGVTTAETDRADPSFDRNLAIASFDSAWSRVNNTYYDPTFGGLDWDAMRNEFRPRVEAARNDREVRAAIQEMLLRIGDSHFGIIGREAADAMDPTASPGRSGSSQADAGFDIRLAEGQMVVTRVRQGGAAEAGGVRPGWTIEQLNGRDTNRMLAALNDVPAGPQRVVAEGHLLLSARALLLGADGSKLTVRFHDGDDQPVEVDLVRTLTPGEPVRFGNLPTILTEISRERIPLDDSCVGVIRFNIWMTPVSEPFSDAVDALRDCVGIILDLRGNPGGVAGMAMGISGHFMTESVPLGYMRTRGNELRLISIPRRSTRFGERTSPYEGPLALLIDRLSMSTTEIFAAAMQSHGRARIFGETSGGQALPAMLIRLPNQDVLMHSFADLVGPDGQRIEGQGVHPDEPVPFDRLALLSGRDEAMEAAVRWIVGNIEP
jgi:carboxyl-terminal processing protease